MDELKAEIIGMPKDKKEIKRVFNYLDKNSAGLSESGRHFVNSLKKYHSRNKRLSERQERALFEIYENTIHNN